jgi:triacylglycerol lipase
VSTGGLVARGRESIFVAFAGTDSFALADWVTDFSIRPDPKTSVAEGFEAAAKTAYSELKPVLTSRQGANLRLYVTGHSLGGAVATVFGSMVEASREVDDIYTFGMPRPGKQEFASGFDLQDRTFRFVHGDDIVPTVAPAGWGFRHVGKYIKYPAGDKFSVNGPLESNNSPMLDERYLKTSPTACHRFCTRRCPACAMWLGRSRG